MPKIDIQPLAELFRANVLKMLKQEGKIDDGLIEKIMKWRHNSGFSVRKITYNEATGRVIARHARIITRCFIFLSFYI